MTSTFFERYVFRALLCVIVLTLSLLSIGMYALGTPLFPYLVVLCWGSCSFAYAYVHVWPRIVPTMAHLERDLRRLGYVVPLDRYVDAAFNQNDVKFYYASTTFRDYRIFEIGTGCNALHTELVPDVHLPYQTGFFQQLVHVIAHMPDSSHTGNILEVGFGKGSNLIYLASLLPKAHLVGVDLMEEHVTYARIYAENSRLSNVSFLKGDATALG